MLCQTRTPNSCLKGPEQPNYLTYPVGSQQPNYLDHNNQGLLAGQLGLLYTFFKPRKITTLRNKNIFLD